MTYPLDALILKAFPISLTQTERLDDGTVAIDIVDVEILQEFAATTYHLGERTGRGIVLVVLLQVLREVLDTIGKQCNLALCAAGIGSTLAILVENLLLLGLIKIHNCCND